MKILLAATAVIEAGTGVALLVAPSIVVKLLLGSPLDSASAIALGRVAGAALFALGIACWLASGDTRSRAARGLVAAMTFYNVAAVAVFMFAGLGAKLAGVALWPAVILHTVMAVGCLSCLWQKALNEPIKT
jgi:hypothetical protein